ncbi:hypothetical protein [Deinococcus arcticus]|uniref:hypothetical protein n=1 Tax=Deinococcus arcticus TaxID=2136176 RepID=UPI0011B2293D|nr:hypothetical protein [Deinococcus arcticus]
MATVTLGEIGQLPQARKPVEGVNYRALSAKATLLRATLRRTWVEMPAVQKAEIYNWALGAATFRPSRWQMFKATPHAMKMMLQLQQTGQLGDFVDYTRTLSLLMDDVLSLSEDEHEAFCADMRQAVSAAVEAEPTPPIQTRAEIDDWLKSLV